MKDAEFRAWLEAKTGPAKLSPKAINNRMSRLRRVEKALGDLDKAYAADRLEGVLAALRFTKGDEAAGKRPSEILIPRSEKPLRLMATLRNAVQHYRSLNDHWTGLTPQSWPELERLKDAFLARCPDFDDFSQTDGIYFEQERAYKNRKIGEVSAVLGTSASDADTGQAILKPLSTGDGMPIRWQATDAIRKAPGPVSRSMFSTVGRLAREKGDVALACATAAADLDRDIRQNALKVPSAADILSIVTSVAAFTRPSQAVQIRKTQAQRAAVALSGDPGFESLLVTRDEYARYLSLIERAFAVMRDEWNWQPRDWLDVQGFLWVAIDDEWAATAMDLEEDADELTEQVIHPLNQILYGPPGTGKTWNTARIAVEICDGVAPTDRSVLMERYNALQDANRIAFTTFHQSIGYEEFVEGLRPTTETGEGENSGSAGFRLEPRNGIFREICAWADQARKRGGQPAAFDFSNRQFFKMSLGVAYTEGDIYDAAIDGKYIVLGWGGDVDWSDPTYGDYDAIAARWREKEPDAAGNSGNISQVWRFRASMRKGDIVIVSDGNLRFRAIGEVVGDYEFHAGQGGWHHRRAVRWLRVLDESLPIETIHDGRLTQASCYLLNEARIKKPALNDLVASETATAPAPAEPFVLIIDEINRANVSKVLGELITLLEPDKRLGEQNALTVKLPYSGSTFGVPNNLYVVGTMNTADRSIALLDTALRRRFHFTEMLPDYSCIDHAVDGIHLGTLLAAINRRVEWLFDRDHQIGHSFFTQVHDRTKLDEVMRRSVIPLLAEYFYEDWEKVRIALNDFNQGFITTAILPTPRAAEDQSQGEDRVRYSIRTSAFPSEAYANVAVD